MLTHHRPSAITKCNKKKKNKQFLAHKKRPPFDPLHCQNEGFLYTNIIFIIHLYYNFLNLIHEIII